MKEDKIMTAVMALIVLIGYIVSNYILLAIIENLRKWCI